MRLIYVLFFIELSSRRVHPAGLTERPDGVWPAQQHRSRCLLIVGGLAQELLCEAVSGCGRAARRPRARTLAVHGTAQRAQRPALSAAADGVDGASAG
jgi:hypothetical protein